jgi:hypothetical protein
MTVNITGPTVMVYNKPSESNQNNKNNDNTRMIRGYMIGMKKS